MTVTVVQQGGDITANSAQFQAASIAGDGPDSASSTPADPTISFGDFFEDLEPYLTPEIIDSMSGFNVNREGFSADGAIMGMPYGAGNLFTVFGNNAILEEAGHRPGRSALDVGGADGERPAGRGQHRQERVLGRQPRGLRRRVDHQRARRRRARRVGVHADVRRARSPSTTPRCSRPTRRSPRFGASGLTNPDAGQVSNGDATAGFVGGNAAYYIVGNWENNEHGRRLRRRRERVVHPHVRGRRSTRRWRPAVRRSRCRSRTTRRHKDLAGEFLRFLAQPENQDVFVELYQTQASNHEDGDPSLIQNPLLQQEFALLQKATDGVIFAFDSVMPQATIDLFYRVNAGVFLGSITPEDAVQAARRVVRHGDRQPVTFAVPASSASVADATPRGRRPHASAAACVAEIASSACSRSPRRSWSSSGSWRSR